VSRLKRFLQEMAEVTARLEAIKKKLAGCYAELIDGWTPMSSCNQSTAEAADQPT
jgi:hypothetical protein